MWETEGNAGLHHRNATRKTPAEEATRQSTRQRIQFPSETNFKGWGRGGGWWRNQCTKETSKTRETNQPTTGRAVCWSGGCTVERE